MNPITYIKNWLLGIEHSVEHIIQNLTYTVGRLETLAEQKMQESIEHGAAAIHYTAVAAAASEEAVKARAVAENIKALVNQPVGK